MAALTFGANHALPPFEVDYRQFQGRPVEQKTQHIAVRSLIMISTIFTSIAQASYITLANSGVSFKYIVLGYYGSLANFRPPADIYLAVFKVAFWMLSLVWCTVTTSVRLFIQREFPSTPEFLDCYAGGEIDVHHIRTKSSAIDVSQVPEKIQVGDLLQIFDAINFTDPGKPGYMKETSRQEYSTVFTVENLRKSLETFVHQTTQRVAFLGTPPAYDTPRLMAFYQQIEDAVRFSIHQMNERIRVFKETNGEGPYTGEILRQYNNLLEDQARIAIDMAIAGKHCGSRYMGEAMNVYGNVKGEGTELGKSLEDTLIELLAKKRYQIALGQIEEHIGTDTHHFNDYMSAMGRSLGLPGTENIVEHLSQRVKPEKMLPLFFKKYSVDVIITAIQDEIKKSQSFREQITDWIKANVGSWNTASPEKISRLTQEIHDIVVQKEVAHDWQGFIDALRSATLPEIDSWEEFVNGLFRLEQVRAWLDTLGPQKFLKQGTLRVLIGPKPDPLPTPDRVIDYLDKILGHKAKIGAIQKIVRLDPATIERVMKGQVDLSQAIKDYLDQERAGEVLEQFNLDEIHTQGISDKLMEWLLVSHKILLPQPVEVRS